MTNDNDNTHPRQDHDRFIFSLTAKNYVNGYYFLFNIAQ